MKPILFSALLVLFAVIRSDLCAASTATRTYVSSVFRLEIDGVTCGYVEKCEGGDLRATVVVESPAGGALPKKHIASPACAPLILSVGMPFDPVIADWINDLCANGAARKTVRLLEYDYNMQFRAGVEADNTALVEVDFPACDTTDKSQARLTLVLAPGSSQALTSDIPATTSTATTVAYAAVARKSPVTVFAFAVAIDGIGTSYVNRVEPITIKRSLAAGAATEFSDFVVSLAAVDAAPWQSWFSDFVVNGNSGDAQEKNGTLTLVDVALQPVLALQFSHLGMVRLSPAPYDSTVEVIRMDQAEMYYEALTLTLGGWASGTSSSGSSTTQGSSTTPGSATTSVSPTNPGASITPPPKAGIVPSGTTPVAPGLTPPGSSPSTTTGATGTPSLSTPVPGSAMVVPPASTAAGSSPTLTTLATSPAAATALSPVPGLPTALPPMPSVPGVAPAVTPLPIPPPAPIGPGATSVLSPSAPMPGTVSPAAAVAGTGSPAGPPPTAATAPTPPSPGAPVSATALTPSIRPPSFAPVTAAPSAISAAAPMAATLAPVASASAAADQTAAALANFPVFSGAVRTSFSSSRGKASWQERANYTIAAAPDAVLGSYAPQIAAAGWNEVSRAQSGDAAAHTLQFTVDFLNGATKAHLVLAQNAQGATTIAVTVTTLFPGNSAPALSAGASAAPSSGATTSAADRGASDPTDFPRLPGSVRTTFTTSRQTASTQEVATYTAKCSPAAADAFYAQSLPGPGWDEITRYEDVNDATKSDQISTKWQNGARSAVLALSGSTAGGCDVRVTITTLAAAP